MPDYAAKGKGGRWYRFPEPIVDGGLEVPSVTTILANGLPAPALKSWGERTVAEWAVDNQESWANLDRAAAIDVVKRAPYRNMTSAGNRGTDIHTVAEIVLEDRPLPEEWADLYAQQVEAVRAWIADFKVKPISWERTVANAAVGYAGTYDLYCEIDGTLSIVDWKSSKGVYGKMGLQLAAYARAEWQLDGNTPVPMPPVEHAGIVHLLREGGYEYRPVQSDLDDLLAIFESVTHVAAFVIDHERDVLAKHSPAKAKVNLEPARLQLRERIERVAGWGDEALEALAAAWPVTIPTLKSGHAHSADELDALAHVLRRIENKFWPAPPRASREAHDEAIALVSSLTEKQLEKVTAKATAADIPNLRTYQATDAQLAQLGEMVRSVRPNRKKPTNQKKVEATV